MAAGRGAGDGRAPAPPGHQPLCHPGDGPCTLAWQSVNPALGVLEGTFEFAGESILSRYLSPDRMYSGCEVLTLQGDGSYYNAGAALKDGRRMSAWTAVLREEKEPE